MEGAGQGQVQRIGIRGSRKAVSCCGFVLSCMYGLLQERAELEAWREQVRAKYEEVGYGAQIPDHMPRQLQVGQRVTARHPVTRQIHDGDILTTAPKYYRYSSL